MPRIDQLIGEAPPDGTEAATSDAKVTPPVPGATPEFSPMLRSPLPSVTPASPDSLRQYYRSGVPQMRVPIPTPPVTGGVTSTTTSTTPVATLGKVGTVRPGTGILISDSGTITLDPNSQGATPAPQDANKVYAGPTAGSPALPTFRSLVATDIPTIAESQVTNLTVDLAAKLTNPMTTIGDTIAEDSTPTPVRVAGNTTAIRKFYRQTGTGAVSALPSWDTVTSTDVGLANVTNDAQTKAAVVPNTVPALGEILVGTGSAYAKQARYRRLCFSCGVSGTGAVALPAQVNFAGTIVGWSVYVDAGTISIDVCRHANSAPPAAPVTPNTSTDKLSASAPVQVSSGTSASSGTSGVSTWTTAVAQWDSFLLNITATTGATKVQGEILIQQG